MNREEFLICRKYASLDLAFSMVNIHAIRHETDEDVRKLYGAPENGYYEWFVRELKNIISTVESDMSADDVLDVVGKAEKQLRELRHENKSRMEFFTGLCDRLIAYEYVLNRLELKFAPDEKLDDFLKSNPEEAFLNRVMTYLVADRDKRVFVSNLQSMIGEIPVQLTRQKLFEYMDNAFKLYLDSDETALDELIYMLKMAGLVFDTDEYIGEYPDLERPLNDFEATEISSITEEKYNYLRDEIFALSGKLQFIIDYYNDLQRCVNDALSLCLVRKWLPDQDELIEKAHLDAIKTCLSDDLDESLFVPMEGQIESVSERLTALMARVSAPDMNGEEEEEYLDVATMARLLSNSIFAEIDPLFVETKKVTPELIREKEEALFDVLTAKMKASEKPVKKAIMAKILEKLPPIVIDQSEIEEYIRLNLFSCRDKAEKCAVMAILIEIMEGSR